MEYPLEYVLRETGTLTQGPNAGMVLDGHIQMLPDDNTLEGARVLVAQHRALEPAVRIEICTRQYRSRPRRHFHYEPVEVVP